ncbi:MULTISPECIES: response regulator transcription factor [Frigoribacterium]|jgi:two-component system KDP operon response regulator KdpE|uniref:response regulator transcription factor n=1 Tax=Frigoribacterium TaxID=96492 RepID=UPI0006FDA307|nr:MULTISPECIES: response regulator transcription factor [Frigoribacterium]KQM23616.1 two-component system response regulator [Frigoribacterium sp. Leaf8]MBD8486818.1 response regulator transcription factor [Frigoribacterium sp. CFBP 8759]ROS53691.1 two-component system KDP operon response regulator KdpE [Frigoribacterium sp. PhB118]VXB07360.1 DNA-binding response regulator in two-component regulatory system with KdpD [Frigoribacterium sp. 9N]
MKILIADDDPQLVRALTLTLGAVGYDIATAADGAEALRAVVEEHPDVVMVDLGMPHVDGLGVIEGLRGWSNIPVLVVSGRAGAADKVEALDAGADDYITKPFAMDELLARLRALTRRTTPTPDQPSETFGGIRIDFVAKSVVREPDEAIRLTPTEWRILEILVRNPGRLVTREDILTRIWGPAHTTDGGYLRLYVSQLRKKLEAVPAQPRYLQTVQGMGYRFVPDEPSS